MQMYEQSREVVYFYSVFSQKKRWVSFPNVSFELYAVLQLGGGLLSGAAVFRVCVFLVRCPDLRRFAGAQDVFPFENRGEDRSKGWANGLLFRK